MSTLRAQTLVAIDWDDAELDIAPVREFLGEALLDCESTTTLEELAGRVVPMWRLTFDANRIRNTEAHGAGYRAGFIASIVS